MTADGGTAAPAGGGDASVDAVAEGARTGSTDGDLAPAALRIVRGDAGPEEVAALMAVLGARRSAPPEPVEERPESWSAYWRNMRPVLRPGPHGWLGSGRPQ